MNTNFLQMVSAFLIRVYSWFDVLILIRDIRVIRGFSKDSQTFRVTSGRISGCTSAVITTIRPQRRKKKNNESADSAQKNTNPASSHRTRPHRAFVAHSRARGRGD